MNWLAFLLYVEGFAIALSNMMRIPPQTPFRRAMPIALAWPLVVPIAVILHLRSPSEDA